MDIQVLLQHSVTGDTYDISSLCSNIKHETYLEGRPGKLTLLMQEDPNNILQVTNGSRLIMRGFENNETIDIFYGFIFTQGKNAKGTYRITAYDQTRYLKNEYPRVTSSVTAHEIFQMVCNEWQLAHEVIEPTSFICPPRYHDKKSGYAVIEYGLDYAKIYDQKQCFIRDDFGVIKFTTLDREKTNLIIGDQSLLMNYNYEISIDKQTFNQIEIIKDDEEEAKRIHYVTPPNENQQYWGTLKLVNEIKDKDANRAQIAVLAEKLLALRNRETQTLKLNVLGHTNLKVGSGFKLQLESLALELQDMWIYSKTDNYAKNLHTMSLDVFI